MNSSESQGEIRVLFIDDEEGDRDLAEKFFSGSENKIKLSTVSSAEEGLELIGQENFDAVISDYKMSGMNGLDLLKELRRRGNDITFILLTGRGKEEVAMEALNLGADRYHRKKQDVQEQFRELTRSVTEEVIRKKSEQELETFQTWIKNVLKD